MSGDAQCVSLSGGRALLYLGDCFSLLQAREIPEVDAVITDPPYSSGGLMRSDRAAKPSKKYPSSQQSGKWAEFSHDGKDQRSWTSWCAEWLKLLPIRDGGYVLIFSDWRQLPAMSDAFQWSGLNWRGLISWDKGRGSRAPHKGYFRHQCEYLIWGTAGACKRRADAGPFDGAYKFPVLQKDKFHMTGKPTPLLVELVRVTPAGGLILDPFMGSGTCGVAAMETGHRFVGIESVQSHFDMACERIERAAVKFGLPP